MESSTPPLGIECADRCPELVRGALELISAKWAAPIYLALHAAGKPLRYAGLQRQLVSITPKQLAKHLRQFAEAGLVERIVSERSPPSVEYALTDLGRSLYPAIENLARWSLEKRSA